MAHLNTFFFCVCVVENDRYDVMIVTFHCLYVSMFFHFPPILIDWTNIFLDDQY